MKNFKTFFEEMAATLVERKWTEGNDNYNYVLAFAAEEARQLNHDFVGTEHVLLGLVKSGRGVAINVLKRRGLDAEKVCSQVEKLVGRGSAEKLSNRIPFTPRVKKVLLTARSEARSLSHNYVGTEHILLGLLSDDAGVAVRVLNTFGLDLTQTRQEILRELASL